MRQWKRISLSAVLALLVTAGVVWAEGGFVQGVAATGGTAATVFPVVIGGSDGVNVRSLHVDAAGNLTTIGGAANGAAATGNPVQIAGQDTAGNSQVPNVSVNGATSSSGAKGILITGLDPGNIIRAQSCDVGGANYSSQGVNAFTDTVIQSGTKTSNGTTAVAIVAAVGSKKVYVCHIAAYNTSTTVFHTVTLITSSGATITEATLSAGNGTTVAGGNWTLDDHGYYQSILSDGLSFKIDAGGAVGDVKLTCQAVQK